MTEMTQKWLRQSLLANATIVIKWDTEWQTAHTRKTQTKATKINVNAAAIVAKWDMSRQIVGIDRRTPTNAQNRTNLHMSMAMSKSRQQLTMETSIPSVNCCVWLSKRNKHFLPSPNSSRIHLCGLVTQAQQNTSPHTHKE